MGNQAILCLGSNIADKRRKVQDALLALGGVAKLLNQSPVYESEPLSGQGEPYCNAIAVVEVAAELRTLDQWCKTLERAMGRDETARSRGEVPIDLDVVVFDDKIVRPRDYSSPFFQLGLKKLDQQ